MWEVLRCENEKQMGAFLQKQRKYGFSCSRIDRVDLKKTHTHKRNREETKDKKKLKENTFPEKLQSFLNHIYVAKWKQVSNCIINIRHNCYSMAVEMTWVYTWSRHHQKSLEFRIKSTRKNIICFCRHRKDDCSPMLKPIHSKLY